MKKDQSATLKWYLAALDRQPLLTFEEERKLISAGESAQHQLLMELINVATFRVTLADLLQPFTENNDLVVNLTRSLDQNSTVDEKHEFRCRADKLQHLLRFEHLPRISKHIQELSLSSNTVHAFLLEIKQKYHKIKELEQNTKQLLEFFQVSELSEITTTIKQLSESLATAHFGNTLFSDMQKSLSCTALQLGQNIHLFNQNNQLQQTLNLDLAELKKIHAAWPKILNAEAEMKKYHDELVSRNLRLVVNRARKFQHRGLELEDLIQEGTFGLMKAVAKMDSSRGTKLSTFAVWWIDQSIRRAISNTVKTVRVPTNIEALQIKMDKVSNQLTQELGREPTLSELAKALKMPLETLQQLDNTLIRSIPIAKEIKDRTGAESEQSLAFELADTNTVDPEYVTEHALLRSRVLGILKTLPEKTEMILRLRFGIGEAEHTVEEIGKIIGTSHQNVSALVRKSSKKLKSKLMEE